MNKFFIVMFVFVLKPIVAAGQTACPSMDDSATWSDCVGTRTLPDGGQYVGAFRDGQRNGQGTLTYPNGQQYSGIGASLGVENNYTTVMSLLPGGSAQLDGQLKEGDRIVGVAQGEDGEMIDIGGWQLADSIELITGPSGTRVRLQIQPAESDQGLPERVLELVRKTITQEGPQYVGEWRDDLYDGQGTITFPDGGQYVGEFRNDRFQGQGTLTFPDGSQYVGEFRNGVANGQGTQTFLDGAQYVGEYRNDKFNGQGTLTFGQNSEFAGQKYVGEWRNGQYSGQGTLTFPDGGQYVGEFRNNRFQGQGTLTFGQNSELDGAQYVGEFRNGVPNGQGTQTSPDGSVQRGRWANGGFLGPRE